MCTYLAFDASLALSSQLSPLAPQLLPQGRRDPPRVAAVQHRFDVRIRSAHRLPSAAAYAATGLRAPDGRVLHYSFPGKRSAAPSCWASSGWHLHSARELLCKLHPGLVAPALHTVAFAFSLSLSAAGEAEALLTQEVPCCSNPSFEASASHEMTVPATQPITPLLQDG